MAGGALRCPRQVGSVLGLTLAWRGWMLRASAAVPLPLVGPTAQRDVRSCPPSTFWFELCCSWQEAHHSWTLSSSSTCWSSLLRVAALGAESPVRAPGLSLTLELLRAPCLQHRDVLGDCLPLIPRLVGIVHPLFCQINTPVCFLLLKVGQKMRR